MKGDRRGKRWTKEEISTLQSLVMSGTSLHRAAGVLKRTKRAIMLRALSMGLSLGRHAIRSRSRKDDQPDLPLFVDGVPLLKNHDPSMSMQTVTVTDERFPARRRKKNSGKRILVGQICSIMAWILLVAMALMIFPEHVKMGNAWLDGFVRGSYVLAIVMVTASIVCRHEE